ncbi:MAG: phosphoribosylamine--glycine ligase [Candidatus Heimdallarchaeota archaeon]|nr:phosphoribosylamine--glycine ligase [Candidatus Heimdallarchaeota archaeon]
MSVKVLLIGNGAREHAIAKKVVENGGSLYSFMSRENPGIADLSKKFSIGNLTRFDMLKKYRKVDFAIVGPENPLSSGITNYLEDKLKIPTCGPRKEVAKIESSKIFTRYLIDAYDIPGNVPYTICRSIEDLEDAIQEFGLEIVIKPDGLTGGKGVRVHGDHFTCFKGAKNYAKQLLTQDNEFLVEEKIKGKEFSLQVFTDGKTIIPMPLVRDYKRAYDEDKGPNTGSMGSYSLPTHDLPFLKKKDIRTALDILQKTVTALKKETGIEYRGILYGQFMKTNGKIHVIEFNVRFGDPEAINVLKLLESDFNEIAYQIINSDLKKASFANLATVCTYLVPKGYPVNPIENKTIEVDPSITSDLYYASVYRDKQDIKTTSSRAIALIETGLDLEEAKQKLNGSISKIKGELFYRNDIGVLL